MKRTLPLVRFIFFFCCVFLCLFSAKSQTLPNQFAGLTVWLKSDSGITTADTLVSAWADYSGKGNHAIQAVSANQPVIIPNALNGYPSLRFKNDFLATPNIILGERTDFIFVKRNGPSVDDYHNIIGPYSQLYITNGGNLFNSFVKNPGGYDNVDHGIVFTNGYQLITRVISANKVELFRNGVAGASLTFPVGPGDFPVCIGTYSPDASRFLNGDITEVLIYNTALTTSDRQAVEQYLYNKFAPPVSLGADKELKYGFCGIVLSAPGFTNHAWSTGENTASITVHKAGKYWLKATNIFGVESTDTVVVTDSRPQFKQFNDTSICFGKSMTWNTGFPKLGYTFKWQDNSSDSLLVMNSPGVYNVKITDSLGCFMDSKSITVGIDSFSLKASLGPDVTFCAGNKIGLVSENAFAASYLWSDNSTGANLKVNLAGAYSVIVSNINGCVKKDTINVTILGKTPSVKFSSTSVCYGDSTKFTDLTTAPAGETLQSWQWDFGDTTYSNQRNPVHYYKNSGQYNVKLTVANVSGCSSDTVQQVKVLFLPIPKISYALTSGITVQFTDNSNSVAATSAWTWNFGDSQGGLSSSTMQHPSHTYQQHGVYAVKLKVQTIEGCMDSVVRTLNSYEFVPASYSGLSLWLRPESGITKADTLVSAWSDQSGKGNHAVQATAANQPVYLPNALNGFSSLRFKNDFLATPSVALGERTDFLIVKRNGTSQDDYHNLLGPYSQLYATNSGHRFNSFVKNTSGNDNVDHGTVFTTGYQLITRVISANKIELFRNGVAGNSLNFSVGQGDFPIFIGTYSADASRYLNGDIAEVLIYNNALSVAGRQSVEEYLYNKYAPPVALGPDKEIKYGFCGVTINAGSGYSAYLWSTGDTTSSIKVLTAGTYWVKTTNIFGLISSDTLKVIDTRPVFKQMSDSTICMGNSLTWNSGFPKNGYSFKWTNNSTDSVLAISTAGSYSLRITDSLSCFMDSKVVKVNIDSFAVKATLGPDLSFCSGNKIGLVNGSSSARSYLWKGNSTASEIKITVGGKYWVAVTDTDYCVMKDTVNVTIKGTAPYVKFNNTIVCKGDSTKFTDITNAPSGETLQTWQWTFGDSTSSSIKSPSHLYANSGIYNVKLKITTLSGCSGDTTQAVKILFLPVPEISAKLVNNATVQFTDSTASVSPVNVWSWSFGDVQSGINNASSIKNPQHLYPNHGPYEIILKVQTAEGCRDSVKELINTYNFIPGSHSGLSLWLRSDVGLTANDTLVTLWRDQSGKGNDATQSAVLNQPTLVPNGVSGFPTLRFKNDYLATPSIVLGERTDFLLVKRNGASTDDYHNLLGPYSQLYALNSGNSFNSFVKNTAGHDNVDHNLVFTSGYQLITRVISPNKVELFRNGVGGASLAFSVSPASFPVYLGTFDPVTSKYLNGEIAEVLIYQNALAASDRQSVENYIYNKYAPPVSLGPDKTLKYGFCGVKLDVGKFYTKHVWSTGDSVPSLTIYKAGTYWIKVTDIFGRITSDTVKIMDVRPSINQMKDSAICMGGSMVWNLNFPKKGYSFKWQNKTTDSLLSINAAGIYNVRITDSLGCFIDSKPVQIKIDSFQVKATLGPDAILCTGNKIRLIKGADVAKSYTWNDGSSDSTLVMNNPGTYRLQVTNFNTCKAKDTITIGIKGTAPVVQFSLSGTCIGDSTRFKDLSTPVGSIIDQWIWKFDDSTSSTQINPVHKFKYSRDYKVVLIVTAKNGCSNDLQKNIRVNPKPVISFVIPNACSGASISFPNTSSIAQGKVKNWHWRFGDPLGSDTSSLKNGVYNFKDGGTYTVKLKAISDSGCVDSLSQLATIKPSAAVNFSYQPTCDGERVRFFDSTSSTFPTSLKSWNWKFGDGSTSFIDNPLPHLYPSHGTYAVTLTVTASNNCVSSINKQVVIREKPKVNFTNGIICTGMTVNFIDATTISNGSISALNWSVDARTDTGKTVSFIFADTGKYNMKLVAISSLGCKDSVVKKVHVTSMPKPSFSYTPTFGSAPLAVDIANTSVGGASFAWDFGDGQQSSLKNPPSHIFATNDTFNICLTTTSQYGCSASICKEIRVIPYQFDIAISEIKYTKQSNTLAIGAKVSNMGTRDIYYFEIIADLGNNTIVKEVFEDTLFAGQTIDYTFKSMVHVNPHKSPTYICMTIEKPNNIIEDDLVNNKQCVTLTQDFQVREVFPNPNTGNVIAVEFILPFDDTITITLTDDKGKSWDVYKGNAQMGLNHITIASTELAKGLYACRIYYRDKVTVKKIVRL